MGHATCYVASSKAAQELSVVGWVNKTCFCSGIFLTNCNVLLVALFPDTILGFFPCPQCSTLSWLCYTSSFSFLPLNCLKKKNPLHILLCIQGVFVHFKWTLSHGCFKIDCKKKDYSSCDNRTSLTVGTILEVNGHRGDLGTKCKAVLLWACTYQDCFEPACTKNLRPVPSSEGGR